MADAGITVSTVAVGQEAVRPLLEDVARIGKGHHYHCDNAEAVPEIFALETATAGKMGIIEKPFRPHVTAPLPALAEIDFQAAPSLLGYVETRPKPGSQTVMTSERGDPLLIWWRYGRGVTVAFTSDVESRWAAAWLRWPGFSRFWAQLARHAIRKREADGFVLRVEQQNRRATVTLDAVDQLGRYVNNAEVTLTVIDPQRVSRRLAVDQVAPGRYAIDLATPLAGVYYLELAVDHGGRTVYGERRGLAVGFSDELRTRPADHDLLRAIAEATGGVYDPSPAALAAPANRTVPETTFLWPYFLAATLVLFVIDVGVRRLPMMRARPIST
jgi:Ca-activated chloride channel family protein